MLQPGPSEGDRTVKLLGNTFDVREGLVLEGSLCLPEQATAAPVGLYVGHGEGTGTAILVDAAGVSRIGTVRRRFRLPGRRNVERRRCPVARPGSGCY